MKKVIFVLALSGLVSFGSFAASISTVNNCDTEISKDGDKKKKKSKKECCSTDKAADKKCCEGKKKEDKKEELPK